MMKTTYTKDFLVFPADLNNVGTLFGGKLLSEMDLSAAILSRRLLYGTECDGAVTASMDKVDFKNATGVGDFVEVRSEIKSFGRTSMNIHVKCVKETKDGERVDICEGRFTFVALKDGKPHPHGLHFDTNK